MSIEVTMRHSDVRIESLKEYAEKRMAQLKEKFPKVTKVAIVIDVDVKKHMYTAEVVANRLGETAVGEGVLRVGEERHRRGGGPCGASAPQGACEGAQGDGPQAARGIREELSGEAVS